MLGLLCVSFSLCVRVLVSGDVISSGSLIGHCDWIYCSNYRVEIGAVGIKNLSIWLTETPQ